MGHRALVAYERTDGQYTHHYSHWGAANLKLKHRISAESPFGGDDTDSKWAKQLLAELADGLEADAVDGYLVDEDRQSTVDLRQRGSRRPHLPQGHRPVPPAAVSPTWSRCLHHRTATQPRFGA